MHVHACSWLQPYVHGAIDLESPQWLRLRRVVPAHSICAHTMTSGNFIAVHDDLHRPLTSNLNLHLPAALFARLVAACRPSVHWAAVLPDSGRPECDSGVSEIVPHNPSRHRPNRASTICHTFFFFRTKNHTVTLQPL